MIAESAAKIARAGQQISASTATDFADELNRQLNNILGWPFQAAGGTASDNQGNTTQAFSSLIFTRVQGAEWIEGQTVNIPSNTLACAIDVAHTINVEGLRQAYERIAQVKTLKKSATARDILQTTITFGVIFAVEAAVPLEQLADELDRLNRQTSHVHWADMLVVASHGVVSYAVQFPGEPSISGQWMPPAEGALTKYIPAVYVVMIIKPSGASTFNQMIHTVLAHLWLFSPGANLPDREGIIDGVPNHALTQSAYQYSGAGELLPVPVDQMEGRVMPQRPFLVQEKKGETLATLQFLKWQDGGVILSRGKLPLDGLMVFLGGDVLKKAGTIRREGLQISNVLPISEQDFHEMLERIRRQTNMFVREDPGKFIVQKLADEGTSSPFVARLFLGVVKLGDTLSDSEKKAFEAAYHPLVSTLLEIRTTAKELTDVYADHVAKVVAGTIIRVQGQIIRISESIDRPVAKKVDEFLTAATRSFKDKMQRVASALGVNIGFLYQKPDAFERGIATLAQVDAPLARYLREARLWGDILVSTRNELEHGGWQLSRISYTLKEDGNTVSTSEPIIDGQPVTTFVKHMTDRLMCFVEEVTVHCIQQRMPAGLSLTEIALAQRASDLALRFQPTLASGGMPLWQITYHLDSFEET